MKCFAGSANIRLERAGCIGLRVGSPQIAPKMYKKHVVNLVLFRRHLFYGKSDLSEQKCLPHGVVLVTLGPKMRPRPLKRGL